MMMIIIMIMMTLVMMVRIMMLMIMMMSFVFKLDFERKEYKLWELQVLPFLNNSNIVKEAETETGRKSAQVKTRIRFLSDFDLIFGDM